MAREGYRSLYGDLTKLKDDSLLQDPANGTGDDDELFQLLLASSEAVDRYCNRHFYALTTTRYFDGDGKPDLLVPDLISVTTLKEDGDEDLTYETTWASTDYHLMPHNAEPSTPWGGPHTRITVRKQGPQSAFAAGQRNYELVGVWGYRNFVEASGSLINDAGNISISQTTIDVDGGSDFAAGQTIRIESEDMLITGISTNTLTVVRGLSGTTAATHADDTAVSIVRWPSPVERATLMNAARMWTRAPAFEPFYVDADLDTDVRLLLDTYRRPAT